MFSNLLETLKSIPSFFMGGLYGHDIFISYSHKDGKNYPNALSIELRKMGYSVFIDQNEYNAGDDLNKLTRVKAKNSTIMIVIARENALKFSHWVYEEIKEFSSDGNLPIFIDIDGSIAKTVRNHQSSPAHKTSGTIAWLNKYIQTGSSPQEFNLSLITIRDPQTQIPSKKTIEEIDGAFRGKKQIKKRKTIISTVAASICILAIGIIIFAQLSKMNSDQAIQLRYSKLGELASSFGKDEIASKGRDPLNGLRIALASWPAEASDPPSQYPQTFDVVSYNLTQQRAIREVFAHHNQVRNSFFTSDENSIITSSYDRVIAKWNLQTGKRDWVLTEGLFAFDTV